MTECLVGGSKWVTNMSQELPVDDKEEYFNAMSDGSGHALGRRVEGHEGGKPSLAC